MRSVLGAQPLRLAVTVLLFGYCLSLIEVQHVASVLADVSHLPFAAAFLCTLSGTVVAKAVVTWRLLSPGHATPFLRVLTINLALRFYTMVLPRAVVTGIRWHRYRRLCSGDLSLVLVSIEASLALAVAALATFVFIGMERSAAVTAELKLLIGGFSLASCCAMFLIFLFPAAGVLPPIERFAASRRRLQPVARAIGRWRAAALQLHLPRPSVFVPVLVAGVAGHLLFLGGGYLLFLSLSSDISFVAVAWVRSAVFLLVSVPVSVAGIGVRELGFVSLFGLYGMPAEEAIAYSLLALIVQSCIGLIGAGTELSGRLHASIGERRRSWH